MSLAERIRQQEQARPAPECLAWDPDRVAEWVRQQGFPQYKECFIQNFISGRRLIHIDMNTLTKIGITDFEHMKTLSIAIKHLLDQPAEDHGRSISLPPRDRLGMYLERKCVTGRRAEGLTYTQYLKATNYAYELWPEP